MNDKQGARMTKWEMKALVAALGVQERVLLFCLASGTDWKQAGVTYKTVVEMMTWFLQPGQQRSLTIRELHLISSKMTLSCRSR
jgi:hypothetical protein